MCVEEQGAARFEHPPRFGQHRRQAVARQVLGNVERERFREAAVRERQPPQITNHEVDAVQRLAREMRAHVDADHLSAALLIPHERPAAAAPEIDDPVARVELQHPAQHVVADRGRQERRRHRLVPRVGVQGLLKILRRLGELGERTQVEELGVVLIESPRAAGADERDSTARRGTARIARVASSG